MGAIENMVKIGGNRKFGNYRVVTDDTFIKYYFYNSIIGCRHIATGHYFAVDTYGSNSTKKAIWKLIYELDYIGCKRITWGRLKVYPRKGTFFEEQFGNELPLHPSYPVDVHLTNPDALVFGTLVWSRENQRQEVAYVGYDVNLLYEQLEREHRTEVHYLENFANFTYN